MPEIDKAVEEVEITHEKYGKITFNSDVIATIAGLATVDVKGVAGMNGGFKSSVVELLGRKNLTKGVKVEVGDVECAVDLHIIVEYGAKIPDVCLQIQSNVREAIETMTGLKVVEVNIHVQGVQIEKKETDIIITEQDASPRVR